MRVQLNQQGITLVEVTLVLAISALALAAVLVAPQTTRKNASFTGSVDQLRNDLRGMQNEGTNYVSDRSDDAAGRTSAAAFGKLVEFSSSASEVNQYRVWTLVQDEDNAASDQLYKCEMRVVQLQDGLRYQPASGVTSQALMFRRNPGSAYVVDNFVDAGNPAVPSDPCSRGAMSKTVTDGPSLLSAFSSGLERLGLVGSAQAACGATPAAADYNVLSAATYRDSNCAYMNQRTIELIGPDPDQRARIRVDPGTGSITREID